MDEVGIGMKRMGREIWVRAVNVRCRREVQRRDALVEKRRERESRKAQAGCICS